MGDRRAEILRFVADEVIRRKAPDGRARIDEDQGFITIESARPPGSGPVADVRGTRTPNSVKPLALPAPASPARRFSMTRDRSLRSNFALAVLAIAAVAAGLAWIKARVLVIDVPHGSPVGLSVRTPAHIATLIRTLVPDTASLNRDPSRDRYRMSVFIVPADDAKQPRQLYRAILEPATRPSYQSIVSIAALGDASYLNGAFLRLDDASEALRLAVPDSALMVYTGEPGVSGTLRFARMDVGGRILWNVDTGIDRFHLAQILTGERSTAFIGTRPAVSGRVSEPLLVIVDHRQGAVTAHSLWQ